MLGAHGIDAIAFPEVFGDVHGALRAELLTRMLGSGGLGLERITDREEREGIVDDYYRTTEHESGLYDLEGLKNLGRQFQDNEGLFGSRVYTVDLLSGLEIHVQAELIDARRMVQVWSGTTSLTLSRIVAATPDASGAEAIEPTPPDRLAEETQPPGLTGSWWVRLVVLGLLVAAAMKIYPALRRKVQIEKATARGGQAIARVAQKERGADLRTQASKRLHGMADRLERDGGDSPLGGRALGDLGKSIRREARAVENLAAGAPRTPIEKENDPAVAVARSLADHDAGTIALVSEIEHTVRVLISPQASGEHLAQAEDLLGRLNRRVGEREALAQSQS